MQSSTRDAPNEEKNCLNSKNDDSARENRMAEWSEELWAEEGSGLVSARPAERVDPLRQRGPELSCEWRVALRSRQKVTCDGHLREHFFGRTVALSLDDLND